MLVYDITNEKSFDNIRNWIRNLEEVSYIFLTPISPFQCQSNKNIEVQKIPMLHCSSLENI